MTRLDDVAAARAGSVTGEPLGVYVHVPFCARACPYCDFDFEIGRWPRSDGRMQAWHEGLLRELDHRRAGVEGRVVDTLYLGGGTPSALGPERLARVLRELRAALNVPIDAEITVEVNPEHVDGVLARVLVESGATRASIGLQSVEPAALVQLGRAHDAARGLRAVDQLLRAGLDVSVDLIVGWPGQREAQLREDVLRVAETGVAHLSVYALTIEPGVPWMGLVRRGLRTMPDLDTQGGLLEAAERLLREVGFHHYEVASYGRSRLDGGDTDAKGRADAVSVEARHNRKYWTWQDVLALGPSASSVVHDRKHGEVVRHTNPRGLEAWLAAFTAGGGSDDAGGPGDEAERSERLDPRHAAKEGLWLGLRRLDGFSLAGFLAVFPGVDRAWVERRLAQARARGLVEWRDDGTIALAPGAWLHHDAVGAQVLR